MDDALSAPLLKETMPVHGWLVSVTVRATKVDAPRGQTAAAPEMGLVLRYLWRSVGRRAELTVGVGDIQRATGTAVASLTNGGLDGGSTSTSICDRWRWV